MARMTGFVFQDKYLERIAKLSDQEVGRLVRALATYHATGIEQELKGRECGYYEFIKGDIDEIETRYAEKCEKNKQNRQQAMTNDDERQRTSTNVTKIKENININKKESTLKSTKEKSALSTGRNFDKLWSVYPRHEGKQAALKAFEKIDPDDELLERMINAITAQKKSAQWSDPQFIPHPATWLNGHRWEDEPTQARPQEKRVLAQQYEQRDYNEKEMQDKLGVYDVYLTDEEYKAKYGRSRQMGGAL